jgi:DNA-binding beta-propeller fold protein YncE
MNVFVEDEYIAVKNGTISWIDPTTGTQIREIKTGYDYTRFASSSCKGEIIYSDSGSSVKCVSTKGNNFTYKCDWLSCPRSHDSDCDGNIYIVGHWSKNIHLCNIFMYIRFWMKRSAYWPIYLNNCMSEYYTQANILHGMI